MFNTQSLLAILVTCLSFQSAFAEDLSGSPLEKTQACLKSQNCMSADTTEGKAADQQALDAVGGNAASKQALYNISSDLMPALEKQAEGDPEKLQAILMKAQTDPEGFLKSLPPNIQAQIKATAQATSGLAP